MKPSNLFQMETASLLASKRALCIKLAFPLLLGLPFVLVEMPLKARLAGLTVLVVMVAFFGSSVSFVRRRREGRLGRLRVMPLSMGLMMTDILLAGTALDLLRLGTVLGLFVFVHGAHITFQAVVTTAGLFLSALLLLNAMGMVLGYAMQENSEIHLMGALASGAIVFISGTLPVPAPIRSLIEPVAPWNPLFLLAEALRGFVEGRGAETSGALVFSSLLLGSLVFAWIHRGVDWQRLLGEKT